MRVAVVCDGSAEALALAHFLASISIPSKQFVRPAYSNLQPKDTGRQIARQALTTIELLRRRNHADEYVVLLDREDRTECPGDWAREIARAVVSLGGPEISVVIKNKKFENWLVADPDGVASLRGSFSVSNAKRNLVIPNKADNVHDAARWLSDCAVSEYRKGVDQERLCRAICFRRVAANSRSFRRFLRVVGHPAVASSSRAPVAIS